MKQLVLLMVLLIALGSMTITANAQSYNPSETYVAVVPVVSITAEKREKVKTSQINCTYNELESQFAERGFKITASCEIIKAINELKIDITSESQINKDNLLKIGEKVGANLVVFVLITESTQKSKMMVFRTQCEGQVKIKMWLVDVTQKNAIKNAQQYDAKRVYEGVGMEDKGSTMQIEAARRVVQNALKDILNSYKVTTKIKRENRPQPSLITP